MELDKALVEKEALRRNLESQVQVQKGNADVQRHAYEKEREAHETKKKVSALVADHGHACHTMPYLSYTCSSWPTSSCLVPVFVLRSDGCARIAARRGVAEGCKG